MDNCYDVIIVGAGLSGIGAAYRMQSTFPQRTFAILEARASMGGTWDLFKYPGIRSDSDMLTMGFSFNPWNKTKLLAEGKEILEYIKSTAEKFEIDKKIKYHHRITDASWNDSENKWTLTIADHPLVTNTKFKCSFLLMCSGYYSYQNGFMPEFKGREEYRGKVVHPQQWEESIDYSEKKVIVIGSGATAVTLVPELAKKASKVFMVQRTPGYLISLNREDKIAAFLKAFLPLRAWGLINRWKNIFVTFGFYKFSRSWPAAARAMLQHWVKKELGEQYHQRDFTPNYNPWDQRLCVVSDSDLFKSIKEGKTELVTDTIQKFTSKGIRLDSGREIEADLIVAATGLQVQLLGGMSLHVNGEPVQTSNKHCYRGAMFEGVPNFAITVGYINASWTLKCDLNVRFVTKVLRYMDKKGYKVVKPRFDPAKFRSEPFLNLSSGFIQRAADILPKQGHKHPWKVHQNYLRDRIALKMDSVSDKYLEYK